MSESPHIAIVAGEPSGDLLGARLMRALRTALSGKVRFSGVGGESMEAAGLHSLFPITDLAVMGLLEVLPRAPLVFRRVRETVAHLQADPPDVLVSIDSWGFTGRVNARLRDAGASFPRVHYVAPQVWAWRAGRAKRMAGKVDHLMCLLGNEPPWFEAVGLPATHVGHPVLESGIVKADGAAFRAQHGIGADETVLAVLPGSRHSETGRLLPVFRDAVARLVEQEASIRVVVPTVATVADQITKETASWPAPVLIVRGEAERFAAFAASNGAIAASGTVALELAMAGVPHVIGYRLSWLSGLLARRLLNVRFANLTNILCDRDVVPELLQDQCTGVAVAKALHGLMNNHVHLKAQQDGVAEAKTKLGAPDGLPPSEAAARVVLSFL